MRVRIIAITDKECFFQAVGALNMEGMSLLTQANYRFDVLVMSHYAFIFSLNKICERLILNYRYNLLYKCLSCDVQT